MKLREIAILGAGNGGQTMAADLALAGFKVNLFELPAFADNLKPVREAGGLTLTGVGRNGFAELNKITSNAKEAVENAELLMVVSAQPGHEAMVKAAGPYMHDGQVMVFNTGYWSALRFQDYFKGLGKHVILAENSTLVYLCVIKGPAQVHIDGIKAKGTIPMAAYPSVHNSYTFDLVGQAFDCFTPASSILETNLCAMNWILHPAIIVSNLAVIERTKGDFTFYREGVTPAVARLIQEVDDERLRLAESYGLNLVPAWMWLRNAYGAKGDNLYEALYTTEAFAPSRYTHVFQDLKRSNFITEDLPYGIVPVVSLAEIAGVQVPTIRAILQLLSVATERDHLAEGFTMHKAGLDGRTVANVVRGLQRAS